jgi:hypothetical protein
MSEQAPKIIEIGFYFTLGDHTQTKRLQIARGLVFNNGGTILSEKKQKTDKFLEYIITAQLPSDFIPYFPNRKFERKLIGHYSPGSNNAGAGYIREIQ